ncbi:hypothetical protein F5B18DRAFT_652627 [Nemania serpens]|nr:hypothetical protein F5B18DRAFT_652627 [Nemania serpens]
MSSSSGTWSRAVAFFGRNDDYIPRYQTPSEVDVAKKRSRAYAHLRNCNLCPRLCGVNRYETTGMCLIGENVEVNVIAPHFGEGFNYDSTKTANEEAP